MRKLFLLGIALTMSTGVFAQEITLNKSGKLGVKTETSVKTPKVKVVEIDKKTKKEKEEFRRKKIEGLGYAKGNEGKAKAKINKADVKINEEGKGISKRVYERVSNEKAPKVTDKVTGNYKGKKVYTGVKGGRYYINSNGNRVYIHN